MADVMSMVTDRIIAALEEGCVPWRKPWHSSGRGAFNRISGRKYSLLNQMMLAHEGEYASFKQWSTLGGHIKRGSKSEIVVFWKWLEDEKADEKDPDEPEEKPRKRAVLKYYRVFHISQVEGVEPLEREVSVHYDHEPIREAERVLCDYVKREGIVMDAADYSEAYYSPGQDLIHVPGIWLYKDKEEYYSTIFHEAIHSTGTANRLHRKGLKKVSFGSETYSREELVAEIGSAGILSSLGIETKETFENSAAYIQGWLSLMRNDKRMVVIAAGQAEKAMKYILEGN